MMNGSDHASPRYIFTKLSDITSIIYNPIDTKLLTKLKDDDGNFIEPEWYIPILPVCLVNGTIGIGTGFSTGLPSFNPIDIVKNLRLLMKGEDTEEMIPWFRGFTRNAVIKKIGDCRYVVKGRYSADTNTDILSVTELPIGISTNAYKEFLTSLLIIKTPSKKDKASPKRTATSPYKIKDFRNNSAGNKVDFTIFFEKDTLCQCLVDSAVADKDGLTTFEKNFKLGTTLSFPGKMTLRDRHGGLMVYSSIDAILREFYTLRLEYYEKRHKMLIKDYKDEYELVNIKAKFVKDVIEGTIIIFDPSKKKSYTEEEVSEQLVKFKYPKMLDKMLIQLDKLAEKDENEIEKASYDYLIGMKLSSLTKKRVDELLAELKVLKDKYNTLKGKSSVDLWEEDLVEFEAQYAKDMKEYDAMLAEEFAWGNDEEVITKGKKTKAKSATSTKSTSASAKKTLAVIETNEDDNNDDNIDIENIPEEITEIKQDSKSDKKVKKTKENTTEEVVVVKKVKKVKKDE
jgi:DNA topoisomerase-2